MVTKTNLSKSTWVQYYNQGQGYNGYQGYDDWRRRELRAYRQPQPQQRWGNDAWESSGARTEQVAVAAMEDLTQCGQGGYNSYQNQNSYSYKYNGNGNGKMLLKELGGNYFVLVEDLCFTDGGNCSYSWHLKVSFVTRDANEGHSFIVPLCLFCVLWKRKTKDRYVRLDSQYQYSITYLSCTMTPLWLWREGKKRKPKVIDDESESDSILSWCVLKRQGSNA